MAPAEALRPAVLDLHKGIADPGPAGAPEQEAPPRVKRCERWPSDLWLVSTEGDRIRGLCKATNLCDYCARVVAVENAEVLALDALQNSAPGLYIVTTTPSTSVDPADFRRDREQLGRAIRERVPDAEWATEVEFTTGTSAWSKGERHPHWNDLVKGANRDDVPAIREALHVWCDRQGADPLAQFVGEISHAGGLMRYLALHFAKTAQAPPKGWRGHRFRTTRGYLGRPMAEARTEARDVLKRRRHLAAAIAAGLVGDEAEWQAAQTLADSAATDWRLVREQAIPSEWGPDGWPVAWTSVDMPIGATS